MDAIIITKQDLDQFKSEIIQEIRSKMGSRMSDNAETWLRTRDVCRILKISPSTLQNLRNNRKIPFQKLNGLILYKKSDIESLFEI
ncbi:MAG: helix-turn-helix domain-containing protein [Candidatus Cloacimonetes bacterium]|nr:helix-turn-helix domain-containing protein [Candidatus Cloacimonadota bacterium]